MALASGHWIEKEVTGEAPSPRHGHALTVAGNVAFLFGGACTINQEDSPVYFSDFFMLTVTPDDMTWEEIPQSGEVPSAREGHTLCVVKGKLYLFGGASSPEATECLPGVYSFDIVSLTWECLATRGLALRALRNSSVAIGDNIYVYGGLLKGSPTDDLMVFNTVSLIWTPVKTSGSVPPALWGQSFALAGDQVFMFGGYRTGGEFCKDLYVFNSANLLWQKWEVKGDSPAACSGQTLTAHHDKLYVFGGQNDEQDFNDLKVMKLINPSERQPVMKEILSEFGLQGISHSFTPTKVPNVRYELSESVPSTQPRSRAADVQGFVHFSAIRDQAMKMIQTAFTLLEQEFQKLDREKSELSKAAAALQRDKDLHEVQQQQQQQELQEMLDKHRTQNEAWLRARAEENDRERRELCRMREEVLQEQERLKEEQSRIQKRSEHLLSIMHQFKGM
ncbi:rab9 effector protein with kelch motifs isoform X2 [Melanotaenia boesemani]|uniref:rab9 effector protein with kelch motifs isoform X2 n=1 Tax=Melanotaenia boesemani TaxID=1250792 RepID=UPI001C041AAB|nr:rab9 effector protein with kelch motifs isoform X2 [Melanotaenia boesemani]